MSGPVFDVIQKGQHSGHYSHYFDFGTVFEVIKKSGIKIRPRSKAILLSLGSKEKNRKRTFV